jgi:hypothetical protein
MKRKKNEKKRIQIGGFYSDGGRENGQQLP